VVPFGVAVVVEAMYLVDVYFVATFLASVIILLARMTPRRPVVVPLVAIGTLIPARALGAISRTKTMPIHVVALVVSVKIATSCIFTNAKSIILTIVAIILVVVDVYVVLVGVLGEAPNAYIYWFWF